MEESETVIKQESGDGKENSGVRIWILLEAICTIIPTSDAFLI